MDTATLLKQKQKEVIFLKTLIAWLYGGEKQILDLDKVVAIYPYTTQSIEVVFLNEGDEGETLRARKVTFG